MHPRDWAHPGRIKVELADEFGKPVNEKIKNSTNIFDNICQYSFSFSLSVKLYVYV